MTAEKLLINRVLSIIPRDCGRVAVTGKSLGKTPQVQLKDERFTIVKSAKVKIQGTSAFQHENENKSPLIKIFFNWLIDSKRKTLNTLRTSLYLFFEGYCQRLPISNVTSIDSLMSNHEEADFRLMVHAKHAIDSNSPVIIKSHSADADIFIMAFTSLYSTNLILYSGTGVGRKIIQMPDAEIEEDNRNALISFHFVTGCDYVFIFPQGGNNKLENNKQQISL